MREVLSDRQISATPLICLCLIVFIGIILITAAHSATQYPWQLDSGTVTYAAAQPDGTQITLTQMIIYDTDGPYVFVRDMWAGGQSLPIYTTAELQQWWTIDVTGIMQTVDGVRILVAETIGLYTNSNGNPGFVPMKMPFDNPVWPYIKDTPTTVPTGPVCRQDSR